MSVEVLCKPCSCRKFFMDRKKDIW